MAIRQRNDPVRLFGKRLVIVGLAVLAVVASWGVWGAYTKERESAALRTQAELRLADLQARQTQLKADILNLQTDRGMEEALREQYALAGKGERMIVIVEPPKSEPVQATSTMLERIKKALWW